MRTTSPFASLLLNDTRRVISSSTVPSLTCLRSSSVFLDRQLPAWELHPTCLVSPKLAQTYGLSLHIRIIRHVCNGPPQNDQLAVTKQTVRDSSYHKGSNRPKLSRFVTLRNTASIRILTLILLMWRIG